MPDHEIHEPTIARVRRDVVQYKCQAAWLDTWSLLDQFDALRARLSALQDALALLPGELEAIADDCEDETDRVPLRAWATTVRGLLDGL